MIEINEPKDLYNLILKQNLTVKQVNELLKSCLPQTAFFLIDNHKPKIIVEILKDYFEKYKGSFEKPIFIDAELILH